MAEIFEDSVQKEEFLFEYDLLSLCVCDRLIQSVDSVGVKTSI